VHPAGRFGVGFSERFPERLGRSAEVAPDVSNELSNYCGADRHPPLDDPGSFGAPSLAIHDHLTCFTPKRSLVRTQYRPPISPLATGTFRESVRTPCRLRADSAGLTPDRRTLWAHHIGRPRFAWVALPGAQTGTEPALPSSSITLAHGPINGADTLTVELVQPDNHPPVVRIVWPGKPSIVQPSRFNQVAAEITRIANLCRRLSFSNRSDPVSRVDQCQIGGRLN
jgi:hypothetical protein